MAEKETGIVICALAGLGLISLLYIIAQKTGDSVPVPEVQREWQMMGMAVPSGAPVEPGMPLDMSCQYHGYHPGYDPDPSCQPVTQSRVRYPAVPGGNISTVMHQGWSAASLRAPAGNDWRINPPEVAVL